MYNWSLLILKAERTIKEVSCCIDVTCINFAELRV